MPAAGSNSDMNNRRHQGSDSNLEFRAGPFAPVSGHAGSSHGVSVAKHVVITPGGAQRRGSGNGAVHGHSHLRPHDAAQRPARLQGQAAPSDNITADNMRVSSHGADRYEQAPDTTNTASSASILPVAPPFSVPALPPVGHASPDVYGAQGVKLAIPDSLLD